MKTIALRADAERFVTDALLSLSKVYWLQRERLPRSVDVVLRAHAAIFNAAALYDARDGTRLEPALHAFFNDARGARATEVTLADFFDVPLSQLRASPYSYFVLREARIAALYGFTAGAIGMVDREVKFPSPERRSQVLIRIAMWSSYTAPSMLAVAPAVVAPAVATVAAAPAVAAAPSVAVTPVAKAAETEVAFWSGSRIFDEPGAGADSVIENIENIENKSVNGVPRKRTVGSQGRAE